MDRDGVLNVSLVKNGRPYPPNHLSQVIIIDGVMESVKLLRGKGYEIVVVTNQPDVARGITSKSEVETINKYLGDEIGIDYFYTCFHDDGDDCECRKPKNALLRLAADDLNLDLNSSIMVGDRWRDIAAGQSVGCACYFIDYSYSERKPIEPYYSVTSLIEATQRILRNNDDSFH